MPNWSSTAALCIVCILYHRLPRHTILTFQLHLFSTYLSWWPIFPGHMPSTWFLGLPRHFEWWTPITPLQLRVTLRRLWRGSHHPLRLFFWLIQPFPWRFRVPRQLSPQELREFGNIRALRHDGILQLRCIPLFQRRDTALRSVYRIYEYLCSGEDFEVGYEVVYFFFHPEKWRIEDIPDPQDDNQERYAILASLIEALVESFNWRYDLGLRRSRNRQDPRPANEVAPEWTRKVGKLPEPLSFEPQVLDPWEAQLKLFQKGETPFTRRNIHYLGNGYFYNI